MGSTRCWREGTSWAAGDGRGGVAETERAGVPPAPPHGFPLQGSAAPCPGLSKPEEEDAGSPPGLVAAPLRGFRSWAAWLTGQSRPVCKPGEAFPTGVSHRTLQTPAPHRHLRSSEPCSPFGYLRTSPPGPRLQSAPGSTSGAVAQGLNALHWSAAAAEQMSGGNTGMERAPIGTETKGQEGEDPGPSSLPPTPAFLQLL